ncbi:MAG: hypothetical protein PHW77_06450 [Eubacteriales bacterium]|nr:hypothetical protein [Eubacteriales bacterium]
MPKKLLCVLLALFCLYCSSCSKVSDLLDKAGAGDLKEKLDTAWSEVGKDAIDNLADSIWREYGFGRSLAWPDTGNGAFIPKLRGGVTEYSFWSDDGKCGCIYMSDVTKDEYDKYITNLKELGYGFSLTISVLDEVYVCDGLYIGLLREGKTLYICYGESVAELDDVYDAARSQNNK